MREIGCSPTYNSPGYDPDTAVDKRIMVSVQPILPIDPARRDALTGDNSGWYIAGQHVPNASDSQIMYKWGTTYGLTANDASWDDRFVRNSVLTMSGAFTGFSTGLAIFGLQFNNKIDDPNFTSFEVGYMASVAIGTHNIKVGTSNWKYWSAATGSMRFGREMTFVPSNTAAD